MRETDRKQVNGLKWRITADCSGWDNQERLLGGRDS